MDAARFDSLTAYAAISTLRLDDMRPHIYRTHDGGETWDRITNGIPDGTFTNAVREDPVREGLLFAGAEQAVHVSFDDGDHWQSLRLNMPATAIRDLVIKDNDLVVGTHGRVLLDPRRHLSAAADHAPNGRVRRRTSSPRGGLAGSLEPVDRHPASPGGAGRREPPDGAILYYWLGSAPNSPVVLEILDPPGR